MSNRTFIFWICAAIFCFSPYAFSLFLSGTNPDFIAPLNVAHINIPIVSVDAPYRITSFISSRSGVSISPSVGSVFSESGKTLDASVSGIEKRTSVVIGVTGTRGGESRFLFNLTPDIPNTPNPPTLSISDYKTGALIFSILDTETKENNPISIGKISDLGLFSGNSNYFFDYSDGKIRRSFRTLQFSNELGTAYKSGGLSISVNTSDIRQFMASGDRFYVITSSGNLFIGGFSPTDGLVNFDYTSRISGSFGISDGSPISSVDIGLDGSYLQFEKVGNILYALTTDKFYAYYVNGNITEKKEIYSLPSNGSVSFAVDRSVILVKADGSASIVNNDYVNYSLYDETGGAVLIASGPDVSFDDYSTSLYKSDGRISFSSSFLAKTYNEIIGNQLSGGVYKDKVLYVSIPQSETVPVTITRKISLKKFSSTYGSTSVPARNFEINVPIVGYGISFSRESSGINPPLNSPALSDTPSKQNVVDGTYYIHIKAYDMGLNGSDVVVRGPLTVDNTSPSFSTPMLSGPTGNITVGGPVRFSIGVSKRLSSFNLSVFPKNSSGTNYHLSDFDEIGNADGFSYVLTYNLPAGENSLRFSGSGADQYGNVGYIDSEYSFNSGWFQVLGTASTNAGIGSSSSTSQSSRGFLFGIESASSSPGSAGELSFLKENSSFKVVPLIQTSSGEEVDHIGLKAQFPEFFGRSPRTLPTDYFLKDGSQITKPLIIFQNSQYFVYNGDVELNSMTFRGNGILLVHGNLKINGDLLSDKKYETEKYKNALRIYVTGDIEIGPDVEAIDAFLHTNKSTTTS